MKVFYVTVSAALFVLLWIALFISVFLPSGNNNTEHESTNEGKRNDAMRKLSLMNEEETNKNNLRKVPEGIDPLVEAGEQQQDGVQTPRRYPLEETIYNPPSMDEVRKNMTLYLHTLHSRLASLAGPTADAETVWDAYLDVTKKLPMTWDFLNKHRIPRQKNDNSIFVSLGTYRDPYCPMTLKSLYAQAKNPERLFVGLLQQNCFEKKCRTGVLVGGKVDDMDTDVDCYKEFCKSPEGEWLRICVVDDQLDLDSPLNMHSYDSTTYDTGTSLSDDTCSHYTPSQLTIITLPHLSSPPAPSSLLGQRSNACNTGQVRLFNVNESESLGPYMARYLGAKFYQGEQYYLQIDSHSEFVKDWDAKLIKMMEDAPARKPVISTYPPDR